MTDKETAWHYLTNVIFNNEHNVPIEYISEFRELAQRQTVSDYCDYLRKKKLPESIKNNPWEWEFLDKISNVISKEIQILILNF